MKKKTKKELEQKVISLIIEKNELARNFNTKLRNERDEYEITIRKLNLDIELKNNNIETLKSKITEVYSIPF